MLAESATFCEFDVAQTAHGLWKKKMSLTLNASSGYLMSTFEDQCLNPILKIFRITKEWNQSTMCIRSMLEPRDSEKHKNHKIIKVISNLPVKEELGLVFSVFIDSSSFL